MRPKKSLARILGCMFIHFFFMRIHACFYQHHLYNHREAQIWSIIKHHLTTRWLGGDHPSYLFYMSISLLSYKYLKLIQLCSVKNPIQSCHHIILISLGNILVDSAQKSSKTLLYNFYVIYYALKHRLPKLWKIVKHAK